MYIFRSCLTPPLLPSPIATRPLELPPCQSVMVNSSKKRSRSNTHPSVVEQAKKPKRQVSKPDIHRPLDFGARTTKSTRSVAVREKMGEDADARRATFAVKYATRIRLDRTLEELRSPVSDKRKAHWESVIARDLHDGRPAIGYTTIYEDSTGHPVLAYFGRRIRDIPAEKRSLDEQYTGRTEADLNAVDVNYIVDDGIRVREPLN